MTSRSEFTRLEKALLGFLGDLVTRALCALLLWWSWNWVVLSIAPVQPITYWQAVLLTFVFGFLAGPTMHNWFSDLKK